MQDFSPVAFAVEEADEEEFLLGPELHQLSDPEHVPWRGGNVLVVEMATRPRHLWIYDLHVGREAVNTTVTFQRASRKACNLVTQSVPVTANV